MNMSEYEDRSSSLTRFLDCADRSFDAGNFSDALEAFECALNISSDNIEARTGAALSLIHLYRHAEAIPILVQLEAEMPTSLELQFLMGDALYLSLIHI